MVDLRVITIIPSQPVSGVQQPQIASNQSSPGTIVNLPIGSVLSGFIINRDASGNPVLRTENGDVTFQSQLFLKIGTEVSIRIENTGGHTSAHILTINGQPPEIGILQSGQEPEVIVSGHLSQNTPAKTEAAASAAPRPVPNTVTLNGTLLVPTMADDGTPAAPSNSHVSLRVISLAPPATAHAPTPAATPANPYNAYVRNIPATAAQTTAPAGTAAPVATPAAPNMANMPSALTPTAQTPVTAPLLPTLATAASPQTTPTATPIPAAVSAAPLLPQPPSQPIPQVGQAFVGVVINNEPTGEAIIQTPLGTIRLNSTTPLPVGSQIQLELATITTPDALQAAVAAATPLPPALATPAQLARSWPSIQNIFTLLLGQTEDPDARSFLYNTMPNAGVPNPAAPQNAQPAQNLPSALMAFIGALRSGDFRSWIGQNTARWLEERGHGELLKKAGAEFTSLARQFAEPPAGQWQSMFFPVAVAGDVQQVRFFVKRDRKDKENEKGERRKEDDTRFVVELDLTQLGAMQMDGFVRRREQDIQFDLVIRSHTALPDEVQKDILAIYNSTGELTGYKGSITFQAMREFPVNPMEDIVSEHMKGVVA